MRKISVENLDHLWGDILGGDSFIAARDKVSVPSKRLVGITRPGRHRLEWMDTMAFIASLPPQPNLSILVTAMSIGFDLYDAAYHAEQAGVLDKHANVSFYGHDYSLLFTRAAYEGFYPRYGVECAREITLGEAGGFDDYFEDTDYPDYVTVSKRLRDMVKILPPSDIMSLNNRFDAVFSNVMNPAPSGLCEKMSDLARHFSYRTFRSGHISDEWLNHLRENTPKLNRVYRSFREVSGMKIIPSLDLPEELFDPAV